MKVLLAEKGELGLDEERAAEWGFDPVEVSDYEDVQRMRDSEESCIIVLHSDLLPSDPLGALELLQRKDSTDPAFVFLVGEAHQQARLLDYLTPPFCDVIVAPAYDKLIERKFEIAASVLKDKQTLVEVSEVMERYAKHIDQIAEERAKQLVHSERLSTIGIMAAGIAHEFNTPISYMMTSLDTASAHWGKVDEHFKEAGVPENLQRSIEKFPKFLERLELGLTRLERLSRGLKSFGRNNTDERHERCIEKVVEDALEMCCAELSYSHLEVVQDFQAKDSCLWINEQQIEQVLINLIINASHASEGIEEPKLTIRTENNDGWLELHLIDNGSGIPDDKIETIWKPFVTTKQEGKGTGLGLYIVKGIVRKHSGSIQVHNNEETGGAHFTIKLPLSSTAQRKS